MEFLISANRSKAKSRILVVDDDTQYLKLLGEILKELDYTPCLADTAWKGLKEFRDLPPQLVITDIFMPYMDGGEFITQILQANFYVPIIAMTGGLRGGDKQRSLE